MTEALDAMVKAMLTELKRQGEAGKPGPYIDDGMSEIDPTPDFNSILIDGRVDLEKVARAGLGAIREPGEEVDAGVNAADMAADPFIGTDDEGVPADPADAREAWSYIIAEILKETPKR